MSRFDFEGRCYECNEKVNIMIERLSSNSMKLTADECLDHPGKSHILWPQRDDIVEIEQCGTCKNDYTPLQIKQNYGNCLCCGAKMQC